MNKARTTSVALAASVLLCGGQSASADDAEPPINTERPSFSASPVALMTGAFQLETGYQYTDDSASIDTFPNLLLRYGFDESWEIQFGWAGENRVDLGSSTIRGATDVSIGVKRSLNIDSDATALALLATVSLPAGNRAFSSDSVDPSVGLLWSHETDLSWFGTALISESDGDIVLSNGIGLSFSLAPRTGAYLEFVTQVPEGRGPAHTLNGGLSFTPQNKIQWDVYGGTGLNDRAADWFVGAGFAIRL